MKAVITAVSIAITLAWVGPSLDDHGYEQAQADELQATAAAELERERFERAAQIACGANAGWYEVSPGVIDCATKRGARTQRGVQVSLGE